MFIMRLLQVNHYSSNPLTIDGNFDLIWFVLEPLPIPLDAANIELQEWQGCGCSPWILHKKSAKDSMPTPACQRGGNIQNKLKEKQLRAKFAYYYSPFPWNCGSIFP
jgi:hypothetical protein